MKKLAVLFSVLVVLSMLVTRHLRKPQLRNRSDLSGCTCGCSFDSFWCVVEQGIADAKKDLNVDVTLHHPRPVQHRADRQDIDRALAASQTPGSDGHRRCAVRGTADACDRRRHPGDRVQHRRCTACRRADSLSDLHRPGRILGRLPWRQEADRSSWRQSRVCVNQQVGHVGLDARCAGFAAALEEAAEVGMLSISDDPSEAATIMDDYIDGEADVDLWLTLGPTVPIRFYTFMDNAGLRLAISSTAPSTWVLRSLPRSKRA